MSHNNNDIPRFPVGWSGNSLVGPADDGDARMCSTCGCEWTGGGDCPACEEQDIPNGLPNDCDKEDEAE